MLDMTVLVHGRHRRLRVRPPGRGAMSRASRPEPERGPGPWVAAASARPPPARRRHAGESTHRMWFRIPSPLPDDRAPARRAARLRHRLDRHRRPAAAPRGRHDRHGEPRPCGWFHRPARADEWLFYDVHSLVNAGGRGLLRGVMRDADGRVVVSVAQEMRLDARRRLSRIRTATIRVGELVLHRGFVRREELAGVLEERGVGRERRHRSAGVVNRSGALGKSSSVDPSNELSPRRKACSIGSVRDQPG